MTASTHSEAWYGRDLPADVDALLRNAAEEAARLLEADGAFVYLLDPATGLLRFTHDAGVDRVLASRDVARPDPIPVGVGIVGRAVAQRQVVVTGDYATDGTIAHQEDPDRFVAQVGLRSLAVAPIMVGPEVFGALGVFSGSEDIFSPAQIGLVRALADHAALAMANARLIAELARSREAVARQAEVERALRELGTSMAAAPDPAAVVQRVIEEAQRLLGGDGARIDILDPKAQLLRGVYAAGEEVILRTEWPDDPDDRLEVGVSGTTVLSGRTFISPDYLADTRFVHGVGPDGYVRSKGIRATIATPLVNDGGVFGAITIWSSRPDVFTPDDAILLETIAGQAAVALGRARLIEELGRSREELAASEERYRFLVENSPDIIYATDAEGRFTFFSGSVERGLGWQPSDVVGRHLREIVRTPDGVPAGRRFDELVQGRAAMTSRMELLAKDGRTLPYEVSASAVRLDGQFTGVIGAARDITDRERLERELRDSEQRYRYLVQSSPDLIWMTDAEGRFTFASEHAQAVLGWSSSDLLGRSFADLTPPDGQRGALARFRRLQHQPLTAHRSRLELLTRDGRLVPMEITGIGMVAGRTFVGAHGTARDIVERERLEQNLRRQAAEIAASEERAHLARELHDSVTQAMFSQTLVTRTIELLLEKDPSAVPARLAELRDLQRDALAELRAVIFELRPGNVAERGLVEALRTHAAALSGRLGLPVVIEADLPDRPSLETEEALYRIAQEALHNVVKHAGAHEARVEVVRTGEGLRLRIADDGRGFTPDEIADGHLGITGMRARAARLGGWLDVRSVPGHGTVVEAVVPERPAGSDRSARGDAGRTG
ncbi:MAG: PAS domain S-box protein [Chloroflexota bacterium]